MSVTEESTFNLVKIIIGITLKVSKQAAMLNLTPCK